MAPAAGAAFRLTAADVNRIEYGVEILTTQPTVPPFIVDFRPAWRAPADDVRPWNGGHATALMASRLLLAYGARGINFVPGQDSLTPADYAVPRFNRFARWDAPVDVAANLQPRSQVVLRTAQLLPLWGEFLASSHRRADFGLIFFPHSSRFDSRAETEAEFPPPLLRLLRLFHLDGLSPELVEPQLQPPEQLLRHPLILFPVEASPPAPAELPESVQQKLLEYVRRGGTLVFFPRRPAGALLDAALPSSPAPDDASSTASNDQASAISRRWILGQGTVLESTKDFFSWIVLSESFAETRARFEAAWALQVLREFLSQARVQPVFVDTDASRPKPPHLVLSQLVTNAGSGTLGERTGGSGLLSVTNLDYDSAVEHSVAILSPRADARASQPARIPITFQVPPRESLLLPLHFSLCSQAKARESCSDEIVAAGAELLRVQRDGRTLELEFYTPARATVILTLAREPGRVTLDENRPETRWNPAARRLEVEIPRGASPAFRRTLRISLPYVPAVPEKPKDPKDSRNDFSAVVADAVRLPLGDDASLPSFPPLVVLDRSFEGQLIVEASNFHEFGRDVDVEVSGPIRGSGWTALDAGETRQFQVKLKPPRESSPPVLDSNGLITGTITYRSGKSLKSSPIFFLPVPDTGAVAYRFDIDRDGSPEWLLENSALRLIAAPQAGGSVLALVSKPASSNVITHLGAFGDHFLSESGANMNPEPLESLAHFPYTAEWMEEEGVRSLRMSVRTGDSASSGVEVVKTIRLVNSETLRATFEIRDPAAPRTFISSVSVPAYSTGGGPTQFCHAPDESSVRKLPSDAPLQDRLALFTVCEKFVPFGSRLELPGGSSYLYVTTPGHPGILFHAEGAKFVVDLKQFSALVSIHFSGLTSPTSIRRELTLSVIPSP